MLVMRQQLVPMFTDINNEDWLTFLTTLENPAPSLGTAGAVVSAMAAISDAGLAAVQLCPVQLHSPAPSSGPYATRRDRVMFNFRSVAGGNVQVCIPAPKAAIFQADNVTVDMSNGLVEAFVAACQAALADPGGAALGSVTSARRQYVAP